MLYWLLNQVSTSWLMHTQLFSSKTLCSHACNYTQNRMIFSLLLFTYVLSLYACSCSNELYFCEPKMVRIQPLNSTTFAKVGTTSEVHYSSHTSSTSSDNMIAYRPNYRDRDGPGVTWQHCL